MVEILRRLPGVNQVLIASFVTPSSTVFDVPGEPIVASSGGVETVARLPVGTSVGGFTRAVRRLRKRLPLHAVQVPVRRGPFEL